MQRPHCPLAGWRPAVVRSERSESHPARQPLLSSIKPTYRLSCWDHRPISLTVSRSLMLPLVGRPLAAQTASSNPPGMVPRLKWSPQPQFGSTSLKLCGFDCLLRPWAVAQLTVNVQRHDEPAGREVGSAYIPNLVPCLLESQMQCRLKPHLNRPSRHLAASGEVRLTVSCRLVLTCAVCLMSARFGSQSTHAL